MWTVLRSIALVTISLLAFITAIPASAAMMKTGTVTSSSFNPSLKQTVGLPVTVSAKGTFDSVVVDRDGYVVRQFPSIDVSRPTSIIVTWDGRDNDGRVVPDEAYSFKVELFDGTNRETYFPGNEPSKFFSVPSDSYDRRSGVLRYTLPIASRIHIQAGAAILKAGVADGPVLKTLVNRSPRPAGAVIEHWRGMDESGSFRVPDLANFVIAIAATSLPENAVMTVGNRTETFVDALGRRRGTSLLTSAVHSHGHHQGLDAYDDIAPALEAEIRGARWSEAGKTWSVNAGRPLLTIRLTGPTAARFAKQPGTVCVFVDQERVAEVPSRSDLTVMDIPVQLAKGTHTVSVNWVSSYGPVAVNSLRVQRLTP